jgi:L-fuconolactonase
MTHPAVDAHRPIVDAHQHFWETEAIQRHAWRADGHDGIARAYGPADLATELTAAAVDATVLIQAEDSAQENDNLIRFAAEAPFVTGVVGWLPLGEPVAAATELERIGGHPLLSGARCLGGRGSMEWGQASTDSFERLARSGLAWDVVPVSASHVEAVVVVARAVPDLRIVVDHLARPPVEVEGWEPWAASVTALAEQPNVAIKLSVGVDVLSRWQNWDATRLRPYVEHVLARFGPDRAMLASNWPVVLLRVGYTGAWNDMHALVAGLGPSPSELAAVAGGTATASYQLPSAS